MTNTAAQITASIRDLTADLHRVYDRIDDAERQGHQQQAQRLEQTARDLESSIERLFYFRIAEQVARKREAIIDRQIETRDRMESEAPRHAAEARIAYHADEDTLDLY
jgi:hypothetical protein